MGLGREQREAHYQSLTELDQWWEGYKLHLLTQEQEYFHQLQIKSKTSKRDEILLDNQRRHKHRCG